MFLFFRRFTIGGLKPVLPDARRHVRSAEPDSRTASQRGIVGRKDDLRRACAGLRAAGSTVRDKLFQTGPWRKGGDIFFLFAAMTTDPVERV